MSSNAAGDVDSGGYDATYQDCSATTSSLAADMVRGMLRSGVVLSRQGAECMAQDLLHDHVHGVTTTRCPFPCSGST